MFVTIWLLIGLLTVVLSSIVNKEVYPLLSWVIGTVTGPIFLILAVYLAATGKSPPKNEDF